jgi:hypothetical protein
MRFPIAPKKTEDEDIPEDIESDEDRFMSFCNKFVYLRSVSLCDATDIKVCLRKARGLFNSTSKSLLCSKSIPMIRIRSFLPSDRCHIVLWGCESWAPKQRPGCQAGDCLGY